MQIFGVDFFYWLVFLPITGVLLGFLINRLRSEFSFIAFVGTLFVAINLFIRSRSGPLEPVSIASILGINFTIYVDSLAGFVILLNAIFAFLTWLYALKAMAKNPNEKVYSLFIGLTLSAANGVMISGNLLFLLIFWNILVFSLYGFLLVGKADSSRAALKALVLIGVADYLMMLGIVILLIQFGTVDFPFEPRILMTNPWSSTAYICILIGALAKAGAIPLHTWIPEAAKVVPASTMAFIPASLDKLLGIYLLFRISYYVFDISGSTPIRMVLMIIGIVTILAAVMMAMIQKEAMRLLSFHAVSQVGYMVLGIGTGIPVAVAGGLFHMINNAIYKACLFFTAGAVEHRAKTTMLDNLGGLGVKMPITAICFVVASFAISGVPPFNGFYSKWMIYQGIVQLAGDIKLWPVFLIAAMFGSVLTLASFLKMIHSLFLGERPVALDKAREASFPMLFPGAVLALACIVFGVFAHAVPLKYLILPSLPFGVSQFGFWSPGLATILILVGLVIGLLVFLLGTATKPRRAAVFTGGENLHEESDRITGPNFFSSVHTLGMLEKTYQFGEAGAFDFYNYLLSTMRSLAAVFKSVLNMALVYGYRYIGELIRDLGRLAARLHTGELYVYIGWLFLGGIVIFGLLLIL